MKIRNESKRTYLFNGGSIKPKEVVDIKDKAIAHALILNYPDELVCLDLVESRVIEAKSEDKAEVVKSEDKAEKVSKIKVKVN